MMNKQALSQFSIYLFEFTVNLTAQGGTRDVPFFQLACQAGDRNQSATSRCSLWPRQYC